MKKNILLIGIIGIGAIAVYYFYNKTKKTNNKSGSLDKTPISIARSVDSIRRRGSVIDNNIAPKLEVETEQVPRISSSIQTIRGRRNNLNIAKPSPISDGIFEPNRPQHIGEIIRNNRLWVYL